MISLVCCKCSKKHSLDASLCTCGNLLEAKQDLSTLTVSRKDFEKRSPSLGVWRFREMVHPLAEKIVTRGEGNTHLYHSDNVSGYVGADVRLKHEGENPTGSFKDRGMTVGVTEAVRVGAKSGVVCASTGNTSASLASYAALASLNCIVLIPEGKIAFGKLSQAIAYGAKVLQVKGNFDEALELVRAVAKENNYYVLNSVNPWRLEGQKTIVWETLLQLPEEPDWIVVPGGNLGNVSAFGKALMEWKELGWLEKVPRLAVVQAEGANPLYRTWKSKSETLVRVEKPETIGTAIRIGNPVNWAKALKYLAVTDGVVEQVTDAEMMDAKAKVDGAGIGCEPSSAASVAGAKKLVDAGVIGKKEKVVCILTGHLLKDPDATVNYHFGKLPYAGVFRNAPVQVEASLEAVEEALI